MINLVVVINLLFLENYVEVGLVSFGGVIVEIFVREFRCKVVFMVI